MIVDLRAKRALERYKVATLHPELMRNIGGAFSLTLDDVFKSEAGFYPTNAQTAEVLACSLGGCLEVFGRNGEFASARSRLINLMDDEAALAHRLLAEGRF